MNGAYFLSHVETNQVNQFRTTRTIVIPKTIARRLAVQYFYQSERLQSWIYCESDLFIFLEHRELELEIDASTYRIVVRHFFEFVRSMFSTRLKIDAMIRPFCLKFKFERLLATDRAVLRLAISEFLSEKAPTRVVIDEAIELAREFGDQYSAKFVNAVLDKVVSANFKDDKIEMVPAQSQLEGEIISSSVQQPISSHSKTSIKIDPIVALSSDLPL